MTATLKPKDAREHGEIAAFLAALSQGSETIETHAASIVLGGGRAFKLKKRVALPFLDFTTLEAREQALRREQDLNSPHAPEIYRGVHAVTRKPDGTLELNGKGPVIDWVLEMRRFEAGSLMLDIAAKGLLPPLTCKALATMVASYHETAPVRYRNDGTTPMTRIADGLVNGFRAVTHPLPKDRVDAFEAAVHAAIARLSPLLDHRAISGAVRRCHGDLHLGNIVLFGGAPLAFDALEFDENLAEIDVLYDLAFLLMDLLRLGDRRAANIVLNTYVQAAPLRSEIDGLATLPLFTALRAAVRSVVALVRDDQSKEAGHRDEARAFLDMAIRKLSPASPWLVAVGGFSGSGKTTMARRLAPYMPSCAGALHLRTDIERKRLFGVPERERLSPDHYTQAVSDRVYEMTFALARRALDQGHSVVVDAVFAKPEERAAVAALAEASGASFLGLWLEAPAGDLIERVETRRGDASDATRDVVSRQLAQPIGAITWPRIRTTGTTEESYALIEVAAAKSGLTLKTTEGSTP